MTPVEATALANVVAVFMSIFIGMGVIIHIISWIIGFIKKDNFKPFRKGLDDV